MQLYQLHFSFLQSGKTQFIKRLLKWRQLLFNPVPKKVIYIYSSINDTIESMLEEGLIHKAIKDVPDTFEAMEKLLSPFYREGLFLILDDALSQLVSSSFLPRMFEEFSHHNNCSIMFVSKSTFLDSPSYTRLSENSHYVICLRNKRNPANIHLLAGQAKPCNIKFILDTYFDAVQPKRIIKRNDQNQNFNYGYYIFNFNLSQPEIMNYMTSIFPNELEPVTVYIEKI